MRNRNDLTGATAILYARRSKIDPANPGKSTTDQLDTQRQRADGHGLDVVAEFTDDGIGASRHSASKVRPGFVAAVDYLRDHTVEVFSLWELSRATRRLRVYSDLMELCEDRGTWLLVGDRVYDPQDPTDQMVLGMTAVQDSAEVARLRERTLRGVASVAASGRPHGRNIYGYERIYDTRTRQLLEVREHAEQGAVVREMVRRTLAGESGRSIAADLNRRGIRKPSGGGWQVTDVREMLARPTYRGLRSHHGQIVTGTWPALISPAEWTALSQVFAGRSRGVHDTAAKHLLTGVCMCLRCERPMYVDIKRGRYPQVFYHCPACSRSRNAAHLEQHVRQVVDVALSQPEPRARILAAPTVNTDLIGQQIAVLTAELDEAYQVGLSPRGLLAVEERVLPQINALQAQLTAPDLTDLTGLVRLPSDVDAARRLLRRLVRVWIGPSRRGRGFDASSVLILPQSVSPHTQRQELLRAEQRSEKPSR